MRQLLSDMGQQWSTTEPSLLGAKYLRLTRILSAGESAWTRLWILLQHMFRSMLSYNYCGTKVDDIIVLHGRTLTTPVELMKCFRSIKALAFTTSEYPVVITLEDHLTTDLQARVVKMVTETFGDMLFNPAAESLAEFPYLDSLKRKIITSTKPPKEYLKSQESKACNMGLQREKDSAAEAWDSEIPRFNSRSTADFKEDLEEEHEKEDFQDDQCAPEYRNLLAIHVGKGKGGLDDWLKVDPDKVRRLSLSEQELENAPKTHGPQIVRKI